MCELNIKHIVHTICGAPVQAILNRKFLTRSRGSRRVNIWPRIALKGPFWPSLITIYNFQRRRHIMAPEGVYWPQISDPWFLAIWSELYFNWLHLGRRIFPEEAIQNVHLFLEHWIWTRHKIKLQLLCSKQPHKDWYAPNKTWCCNSSYYFILAYSRGN